jgi:hypothetical protein
MKPSLLSLKAGLVRTPPKLDSRQENNSNLKIKKTCMKVNGLIQYGMKSMDKRLIDPMLGFGVWDTPTPIVHNVNIFLGSNEGSGWRSLKCRTALLSEITGITFFCDLNSRVVGFHMHTPSAPSAQPTHERLMPQAPGDLSILFWAVLSAMPMEAKPLSWIYVPLPRRDPLAIFGHGIDDRAESGVKSVRSYLVCTSLAIQQSK